MVHSGSGLTLRSWGEDASAGSGELTMSIFTKDNTEVSWQVDGGEQRTAQAAGMVVALEHWPAGLDTTEYFKDLPDGSCQEQHWGYVLKGRMTMIYSDGTKETLSEGQAYYVKPGHNALVDEDVDLVELTPANQHPDQEPGTNLLG
jgi:hypothetical protein